MANLDITVVRGADWSRVATIKYRNGTPVNINGSVFTGQVKNPNATEDTVAATFTFTLVTDGSDGKVTITLPKAQGELLRPDRLYIYDLFTTIAGKRYRFLWGNADVPKNTTPL